MIKGNGDSKYPSLISRQIEQEQWVNIGGGLFIYTLRQKYSYLIHLV